MCRYNIRLGNRFQLMALMFLPALVIVGCTSGQKAPAPKSPAQLRGERMYQTSCAVCHRTDSTAPLNGPGLKGLFDKKFLPSGMPANDERVTVVIRLGRRDMPGYSQMYDDKQIADIVAYLHTL
ncbi:MAG TPA: cytochrome c [Terriglobales bacterium]|nr:cytochrome c [Terriglobales bacterium]